MKKYRITYEGDGEASNTIINTIGGIIDAVMCAMEYGGTATVSEIPDDSAQTRRGHCQCDACRDGTIHASDCAVHNAPAYPKGPCDCVPECAAVEAQQSDKEKT